MNNKKNITIAQLISINLAKFNQELDIIKYELEMIICNILRVSREYLYLNYDVMLDNNIVKLIDNQILRLLNGEPLSYIIGYKYFWNQKLYVTKDIFIPRADTELLVSIILNDITNKYSNINILDLGTGSGSIALALASELINSKVTAIDLSYNILDVAKHNAKINNINNVVFIKSDWYKNINDKFDIIVSNPPYIDLYDTNIDYSVKKYEPPQSLFAKDNGLQNIKIIISNANNFLKNNGCVYIEHGFNQSNLVKKIFFKYNFTNICAVKDLNNKYRFIKGIYTNHFCI